jgi:kumamolisin
MMQAEKRHARQLFLPADVLPFTGRDSGVGNQSLCPSQTRIISDRYRFPPHLTGKGECIAILAFGGRPHPSNLIRFFEQETGVVPDLRFRNATSADSPNQNSRHDMETALDIQVAGALAPGARIVTYFSTNDEKGWVDVVSQAIHDRENRPSII